MKKIYIILALMFISANTFAQKPSDATLKKQIRKRFSTGTIHLGGSSTSKEKKGLVWHYYYWRHFTLSKKAKSGIVGIIKSAVIYEKFGNSYQFHNYATITTEVGGMKPLNKTELVSYLNNHLEEFLGGAYNDIVGEMPKISIPNDTKFKWTSPEQVTFIVKAVYSRKISNTQVEKAEHIYETMLFKNSKTGKWNRILADEIEGMKKVIAKKAYNSSMKVLSEIDQEQSAAKAIKSLPWVENPPIFKSDKQLFYFIHDRLMASAPQEAKAHLYTVLASSSFQRGKILKNYVQDWVDKLINNLKSYQYTFCKYPKVKDEQNGMIYFYNKDKSRFVRMTAKAENGTWKIKVIEYFPASQAEINRLWKQVGDCADKPDLAVKKTINYKIGDIVDVTFSNGIFAGEVNKLDTGFKNRYYVTLLNGGRGYWVKDDVMQASKQKKASLQVNDHVNVKTGSGTYKGTILEIKGGKALIKWDDAGYKNLWTSLNNLSKI
jgi:hypothetical protein